MRGICVAARTAVVILAILLATVPAPAQKVKVSIDQSADFAHFKRYKWGKNYLITRQTPDDQKAIGDEITASINRQLQAKGFVHDESNADFLVSYEAGGLSKADISTTPDLSRDI